VALLAGSSSKLVEWALVPIPRPSFDDATVRVSHWNAFEAAPVS
jgi:hypothetical protein